MDYDWKEKFIIGSPQFFCGLHDNFVFQRPQIIRKESYLYNQSLGDRHRTNYNCNKFVYIDSTYHRINPQNV